MDNVHDLVNNLKKLSQGANRAEEPMKVDFAEVKKVDPLELDFGEFTATEEDEILIVSEKLKILAKGEFTIETTDCSSGSTVEKVIKFKDPAKLKKGDAIICIQDAGGENWIALDRVEVDDE